MLALTLGLACLLLLQLVVVARNRSRGKAAIAAFCVGLVVVGASLYAWFLPPRYLPSASTAALSRQLAEDVKAGLADPENTEFFLVDGGSYTARGIDSRELQESLSKQLGRRVKVLVVAVAGGNHPERWTILGNGLALLDAPTRARFSNSRITLLLEIHPNYDRRPLTRLDQNGFSDRAYAYLGPSTAWRATGLDHGAMEWQERIDLWRSVWSHAAMNLFNVGAAARLVAAEEVVPVASFDPVTQAAPGFSFRGMGAALEAFDNRSKRVRGGIPTRNVEARRRQLVALTGAPHANVIYYSVASARPQDLAYAYAFCRQVQGDPCVHHARRGLLKRLDASRFWHDNSHLQKVGAGLYTRWLARMLVREVQDRPRPVPGKA